MPWSSSNANSKVDNFEDKKEIQVVNYSFSPKSFQDIETEETEDGLLMKGVPVFATGTHRGNKYDEKYIDDKLVGQFKPEDNIPIQADHSQSYKDTLGYIKGLVRNGKILLADMLLKDDNAISRWKKGLMKKWSAGIYLDGRGLREISAVAFPYVKEASVMGEDYVVEESKSVPQTKKEVVEIEAKDLAKELETEGMKITKNENTGTYSLEIGEDVCATFTIWTTVYKNSLSDSSFALVKSPVKDKATDRALPYKDKDGKIDAVHVRNALASIDKVEGFSDEAIKKAKTTLINAGKSVGIEVKENKDDKLSEVLSMEDIKKIEELAELKAKELLSEAEEKATEQEKVIEEKDKEITEKDEKIEEVEKEKKELEDKVEESDVKDTVAGLKSDGKVLPAEEEKVTAFMLKLGKEERVEYVSMLKGSAKKVELDEKGKQKSEKADQDDVEFAKYKLDIEEMSTEDIEQKVELYSKDKGIPVDDARDVLYEKYTKTEKE